MVAGAMLAHVCTKRSHRAKRARHAARCEVTDGYEHACMWPLICSAIAAALRGSGGTSGHANGGGSGRGATAARCLGTAP